MALLAAATATLAGTNPGFVAAGAGGDTFQVNSNSFLHVRNASGGSITVTVVVPGNTEFGIAQPDPTVSVPAAGDRIISLRPGLVDPATGLAGVTYSAVTSVTVALIVAP
jgi:uncharacterized protein YaiE (UPF0345 family)